MKTKIKQRIEQIRNGEVPEGYKRTRAGIMPCDWCTQKEYKAKDIFYSVSNKNHNGDYEVLSATQDRGVIPRSQVDIDIKYDDANTGGYKMVDKGDFVISLRSFQGGIEYSEYTGLVSPAYTVLKPRVSICDEYYKSYFKTNDFISRLNKGTYGIRDGKQVGFKDFGEMTIHFPPLPEQQRIAKILSTQDKVIECYEKKIEQLRLMKKYYLQNMFPMRGETIPKIRFKGFTDAWEQRKITELGEIFIGLVTTMTSHYTNHGALLIRNSDIKDGRFEFGDNPIYLDYDFARQNAPRKHRAGDVITVHTGDIGTSAVITEKEDGSIGFATIVTRPNNKIIKSKYLCTYLNTDVHKAFAMNMSTGDGRNNYNLKDFYKCIVPVPSIPEQAMVSEFIEKMNNLITLQQRLRDEEKKKKKALQQLLLTGIVRL